MLEPYSNAELKSGKTPDFKLRKDGNLSGYCEMKSPRDDYVFGPPDENGVAVRKNIPYYRKLGSHIRRAARQFDAVNPGHKRPNILVFVNHASDIERRDVIATVTGIPVPGRWNCCRKRCSGKSGWPRAGSILSSGSTRRRARVST